MKKTFLSSLFLYFSFLSFLIAQNQDTRKVEMYISLVDSAEISITTGQFENALRLYQLSFKLNCYIHTADLYNAAVLSVKLEKHAVALPLIDSLVLRGFSGNYFLLKSTFKNFRSSPYWTKFMDSYLEYREKYFNTIDFETRHLIESMFLKDQFIHGNFDKLEPNARQVLSSENMPKLSQIIRLTGYPLDSKIGCFFSDDTTWQVGCPIYIMILHAYMCKNYDIPSTQLRQLLELGLLKPEQFIIWHNFELEASKLIGYGIDPYYVIHGVVYKENLGDEMIKKINENRKAIMGCSHELYCKKIENQYFTKSRPFITVPYRGLNIWNIPKEEVDFFTSGFIKTNFTRDGIDN